MVATEVRSTSKLAVHVHRPCVCSELFTGSIITIITLRASCGAVYCNLSCGFVDVFVGLVTTITRTVCIDPHQTGFVGKGSDHIWGVIT